MDFKNNLFFSLSREITTLSTGTSIDGGIDIFARSGSRFRWRNILFVIIGTIGVIGNLLTTLMIMNQSILDLCGSIMMIASAHVRYDIGGLSGICGDLYCKVWMKKALLFGLFCSSTYNLVIITVEKYW